MRRPTKLVAAFVAAIALSFMTPARAADSSEKQLRKIHAKVAPVYPDLARKLQLRGTVRVEVTIGPSGTITKTRILGGNPLLSRASLDALAKWKYDPGPEETKIVEFVFGPIN